jgi:hypothetical protein
MMVFGRIGSMYIVSLPISEFVEEQVPVKLIGIPVCFLVAVRTTLSAQMDRLG